MSRLCRTRTPWMHDSSTCAPCAPSELLLKSKCKPAVDSLHAKPSSKCFSASNGNLHDAIFRCLRLNELVKNCLNDGGISLPFLVLKKLCDTFKRAKCVEHPRKSAPNNCENQQQRQPRLRRGEGGGGGKRNKKRRVNHMENWINICAMCICLKFDLCTEWVIIE